MFCHNPLKPGENYVISMVLQPGLAATTPSIISDDLPPVGTTRRG